MLLTAALLMSCLVHPPGYDYGKASWYGHEWTTGRRGTMANGKRFNPHKLTAASYAYPLGTVVEVTNLANGRRIVVTITDRGPAKRLGRLIDLSEKAASIIGCRHCGVADVAVMVRKYK